MALHRLFLNSFFDVRGFGSKYVSNFYNDVTEGIEVYESDNPQPDTDTPIGAQINGGNIDPTAGIPIIAQYKFCDGSTLNEFERIASFPYAQQNLTANSPACVVNVCDLQIDFVDKVRNASDYDISVQATSSNVPIEYSINGVNFQSSNQFTGLTPGTYTVYARDDAGCTASLQVILDEINAYGEKFRATAVSQLGDSVQIKIYELDYSGAVSIVNKVGKPFLIFEHGKKGEDKYTEIKTSQLIFRPYSEVDLEWFDFQLAQEQDYKAEYLIDGTVLWQGFLNPSLHGEPLKKAPYISKLHFIDGLKLLQSLDYDAFQGRQSALRIIKLCLDKLDMDLDIWEAVNLFETRMSQTYSAGNSWQSNDITESPSGRVFLQSILKTAPFTFEAGKYTSFVNAEYGNYPKVLVRQVIGASIELDLSFITGTDTSGLCTGVYNKTSNSGLLQAFHDTESFRDMNCYEVLEEVLRTYNAQIRQVDNHWLIENANQKGATYKCRKFDWELNYIEEVETDRAQNIDCDVNYKWVTKREYMTNVFAIKKAVIEQDYQTLSNILKNSVFDEADFDGAGSPISWAGNASVRKAPGPDEDVLSVALSGQSSANGIATYIQQNVSVKSNLSFFSGLSYMTMSFRYYVQSSDAFNSSNSCKVVFRLKMTTADHFNNLGNQVPSDWWLDGTLKRMDNSGEAYFEIELDEFNTWKEFNISFRTIGIGQDYELTFLQAVTTDYTIVETRFADIKMLFLPANQSPAKSRTYTFDNLDNKARDNRDIKEVIFGDAPITEGNATLYKGAITLADNKLTEGWNTGGADTDSRNLHQIMANQIVQNFKRPSFVVTGLLQQRGANKLNLDAVISEYSLDNIIFAINYFAYDPIKHTWDIELVEVITEATYNIIAFLLEDGEYFLLEDDKVFLLEDN